MTRPYDRPTTVQRGFRLPVVADELLREWAEQDGVSVAEELALLIHLRHYLVADPAGPRAMLVLVDDDATLPPGAVPVPLTGLALRLFLRARTAAPSPIRPARPRSAGRR